ncbi:MAG TPA: hypothetical protein DEH25_02625, partial [Chloroflexi bacterium]|nr:hypothetical protein [Chloroflexota bacterium]
MRLNCRIEAVPQDQLAPPQAHFHTAAEFQARFAAFPAALSNITEITERCNLILPLGEAHYPEIGLHPGETADSHLRKLAESGAQTRYGSLTPEIRA